MGYGVKREGGQGRKKRERRESRTLWGKAQWKKKKIILHR